MVTPRSNNGEKLPYSYLLMRQKPAAALAELLPRLRFVADRAAQTALPRPGVSAGIRAAALAVARAEMAKPTPAPKPGEPKDAPWIAARTWAMRIIHAVGDEVGGANGYWVDASIEDRLGLLGSGRTLEASRKGDTLAIYVAQLLHNAGYDSGDALLLASAADAKTPGIFRTLLGFPPESAQSAMVAAAQHHAARQKEIDASGKDE